MASPSSSSHPGPEQMVTVKVLYNDSNRRFKLPLKELKAQVFPQMVWLHSSSGRTSTPTPSLSPIFIWIKPESLNPLFLIFDA
jgi:hypothetical protein